MTPFECSRGKRTISKRKSIQLDAAIYLKSRRRAFPWVVSIMPQLLKAIPIRQLLLACIVLVLSLAIMSYIDGYIKFFKWPASKPFNRDLWAHRQEYASIQAMAKGLVASGSLKGQSVDQIKVMLGKPDLVWSLPGSEEIELTYYIGPPQRKASRTLQLIIRDGKVIRSNAI